MTFSRRDVLKIGLSASAGLATATARDSRGSRGSVSPTADWRLSPHLGQFPNLGGEDPVQELSFLAEQGFTIVDDYALMGRAPAEQARIADAAFARGMQLGAFVGLSELGRLAFGKECRSGTANVSSAIRSAVDVAQRTGARYCLVVPGCHEGETIQARSWAEATRQLHRFADQLAAHGTTLLIESLHLDRSRRPLLANTLSDAVRLSRAVGHPDCRVVCDVYRWMTAGDGGRSLAELLSAVEAGWDQIATFQIGDVPGRKEPGTGRLDFGRFLAWLSERGFDGTIQMEHGASQPGAEGELAVLAAYKQLCGQPS